ncbi:uncharacterized protein J3R85_008025 [Psidium guajava]|nr:uncharacterized protein J3R85_008025 [Psidium guajava]
MGSFSYLSKSTPQIVPQRIKKFRGLSRERSMFGERNHFWDTIEPCRMILISSDENTQMRGNRRFPNYSARERK